MFIQVRLLKGFQKTLTYKVPDEWEDNNLVGKIVKVPIRNREASALVVQQFAKLSKKENFEIRAAIAIEPIPEDTHYHSFIQKLYHYYQVDRLHFVKSEAISFGSPAFASRKALNLSKSLVISPVLFGSAQTG